MKNNSKKSGSARSDRERSGKTQSAGAKKKGREAGNNSSKAKRSIRGSDEEE